MSWKKIKPSDILLTRARTKKKKDRNGHNKRIIKDLAEKTKQKELMLIYNTGGYIFFSSDHGTLIKIDYNQNLKNSKKNVYKAHCHPLPPTPHQKQQ